jgi:hypothetical protein
MTVFTISPFLLWTVSTEEFVASLDRFTAFSSDFNSMDNYAFSAA